MTVSDNNSPKLYFQHLDVVRFLAAFMIVMLHSYEAYVGWFGQIGFLSGGTYTDLTPTGSLVDQFLKNMHLGVEVFFLISGFLITSLLLMEKERNGRVAIGKFILRRTLRIWPLYFFLIAIAPLIVSWLGEAHPNYVANSLFLGNFNIMYSESWASYPFTHFWSICIEEHFYLVWPFIIAFVPRKYLLHVFIGLILFSIGYRYFVVTHYSSSWFRLYLHTLSRMDALVIGALAAWFYVKKPISFKVPRFVSWMVLLLLIIYLCLDHVTQWDTEFEAVFSKFIYLLPIGLLLLNFNFNPQYRHLLKPKSFVHYLGKISYGIYMYHNILILIIIKQVMHANGTTNMYLFFGLEIALTILISIVSYELLEKPFLRRARRFRVIGSDR